MHIFVVSLSIHSLPSTIWLTSLKSYNIKVLGSLPKLQFEIQLQLLREAFYRRFCIKYSLGTIKRKLAKDGLKFAIQKTLFRVIAFQTFYPVFSEPGIF